MSDDGERGVEEWPIDRQHSLELLELALAHLRARRPDDGWRKIELRDGDWDQIIAIARVGLRKGQGRGGKKDTRSLKLSKEAVVRFGRKRKQDLVKSGMKATGWDKKTGDERAEAQAAEEARRFAAERYGLNIAASTITRRMQARH